MSWPQNIFLCGMCLLLAHITGAEVMVQLNINRPIFDVSDKFVSFTMKPEDLFKALDSSNRKTITSMASMLSHSHVKFVGDYYFAAKSEGIRLRNPTKIVWKGFNKWTKAVNWSMIIPVPYTPDNWEPMETLKILNTSQMLSIDEAIWQLGTDFGFSRAADYASELKTFNIMVDSFKHTVAKWQTMGADISAGSSPEETQRYVEMSRDLNAAYGWIQSEDMFSTNSVDSLLERQDPALRVLFKSKVPIWMSFSTKQQLTTRMDDEVTDGFRWAQTMGEAANMGFDTIFKALTLDDMERPKFSFYVTVLFKKIMGSRVYPARPMAMFNGNNKLYTHCANTVSGGLAFMVVNKQEHPLQITIRSMNRLQDTEVWQYTLTMHNGDVMLNNEKLNINSTLMPEVRRKNSLSMLQFNTPGSSVSFWVLPNADLEHCHFTEVETPAVSSDNNSQKIKRYSSSDRLLKELIKESTRSAKTPVFPLAGLISRHRRSVDNEDRHKRFVLEETKEDVKPLTNIAGNLVQELKAPFIRDIYSPERRTAALEWLSNIFKEPLKLDLPLLKRNARQSNSQMGPFFLTRDGRKTTFTKKITEIKKPEKKNKKIPVEDQEFDEEKFFKNVGVQPEPDYVRIPEGDVFLSNIASINGDEEEVTNENKKINKGMLQKKEIVSEMKPLRLLPTEFFETFPNKPVQLMSSNSNFGPALNSLLYPDLFGKTYVNNFHLKEAPIKNENHKGLNVEMETHDPEVKAQIDINQNVNRAAAEKTKEKRTEKNVEGFLENDKEKTLNDSKHKSYVFGDSIKNEAQKSSENDDKSVQSDTDNMGKFDEIPWWEDLSSKRLKRSLETRYSSDSLRTNMISKDDDPIVEADDLSPVRLRHFEHKVDEVVRSNNNNNNNNNKVDNDDISIGSRFVKTFKEQFTKLVDIISHHANDWYNTLSKQLDSVLKDTNTTVTDGNRVA